MVPQAAPRYALHSAFLQSTRSAVSMDPYSYTPLDIATNEIRLIRLLPGLPPRRLEVEIFHVPLSAEEEGHAGPVYEALSYVWGSTSNPQFVAVRDALKGQQRKRGRVRTRIHRFKFALSFCGNPSPSNRSTNEVPAWRTLSVTHNLAVALEHLRRPTDSRIFWIDAICINQDDRAERSAQVGRMGTIYSIASQVVVWFGPQYENSTLAVQTLRYIGESWKLDSTGYALNWMDNREGNGQAEEDERRRVLSVKDVDALEAMHLSWIAIRDLLRRQWFSRLWVFQEIRKATQAILVVGHAELPWDMFRSAFYWICNCRVEANPISKIIDLSDCSRVEPFVDMTAWSNVGIAYLTNEAMTELSCSDPRDRVYALLSLFDPKNTMEISPDYLLSVEDVYTDFFTSVLHQSLQLYLLQLCGFSHGPSQLHLPSWAPDFSARRPQVINFSASAGQSEHEAARIDAATLRIRGVLGDTIEHVTEPVPLTATTSFRRIAGLRPDKRLDPQ
ncbi:hypothetical protein W97_05577 [Coniosporium apollinis CBS 100218]|uniref:Heterokaryon incompatibility domain-containing protein n=1 Tax=Coniosporium apollinis (strain CBS 100218) TaxID=1168221 RepID=R7YXE7_CONA1|nr:uncharacterized protein W97_05577 [Coniosporium apollinis CBS 100218]EON66479.1 hypothetical protein W97_05577 [Coniosporium apollinis CBS 100218]